MGDKTKNKNGEKRKKNIDSDYNFLQKNENQQAILKKCQEAKMEQKKVIFKKVRRQKKEAKTFCLFVLKCNAAKKIKAKHNSRF